MFGAGILKGSQRAETVFAERTEARSLQNFAGSAESGSSELFERASPSDHGDDFFQFFLPPM